MLAGWVEGVFGECRLVVLTGDSVCVGVGDRVDGLVGCGVWGLVRSAQAENPDRFVLVDVDGDPSCWGVFLGAVGSGEPQVAIRDGGVFAARLARAVSSEGASDGMPSDAVVDGVDGVGVVGGVLDGSVLVTGGTGGLGALVARHLVVERGVGSLVLVSRSGLGAVGAVGLVRELEGLGARVSVVSCDVSDRDALVGVLDSVPVEFPLCGVVHAAGVLDDGVIGSLTDEMFERVLAPKVDAAWYLHELTEGLDLGLFVLFSSAAATMGSAGQGNYAAANAFLDGLASYRRARGLAGVSLAWGFWEEQSAMTSGLGEADLARMARQGILAMSSEEGLGLFDAACASGESLLVPIRLDMSTVRSYARQGSLPALLSGLVRVPSKRKSSGSLARRLAGVPEADRHSVLLELVRSEVALVLGHSSSGAIDPDRAFKDLGFDSLAAVELRNRLNTITGLRLPATLVFDYPNSSQIARYLLEQTKDIQAPRSTTRARSKRDLDEPIAIVGMSCRYPGNASSPQGLWDLLASATDAIGEFPQDRGWDLENLYDPDPDQPGTSYARHGGFLYDAAHFDADFFGISPREALGMDPQQRLFLETSWETLENAQINPTTLRGTNTGVFAGIISIDYGIGIASLHRAVSRAIWGQVSRAACCLAGSAYVFGLEGPAMTVDTACSSSLVSLHLAFSGVASG